VAIASAGPSSPALTASWIRPKAKATVKTTKLELAAKVIGAVSVHFRAEAADGSFAGCRSTKPTKDVWSCTIDLLAKGFAPGALTVSFEVQDPAGLTLRMLAPTRLVNYHVPPPKPITKFTVLPEPPPDEDTDTGIGTEVDKITWTSPPGYATEFRLYGVQGCLNASKAHDGDPCLVQNMSLPAKSLEFIKKVRGSARSMTLTNTYTASDSCGVMFWCGDYGSLVMSAYNDYGHSTFAIVATQEVCWNCIGP